MKKILALILCMITVLSLLAGCGKEKKKETRDSNTLIIGIPKHTSVSNYDDNYYTKWLEEKTGLDIKFQLFASGASDNQSQLSTMVLGNVELPDMLLGFGLGTDTYNRYGKDKVFVDLAPYFNDKEKSAIWWEQLDKLDPDYRANILRRMESTDGSKAMYAFPEIQQSEIDIMKYQVWINQAWLDYLKLEMPTDPESLYNVLKAFKTGDPNQNGIADEIPLVGADSGLSHDAISWLINMFIYADNSRWFNVDENGKLYSPYRQDAYREALKYMSKLYDEGLMSSMTLTEPSTSLQQLVCPDKNGPQLAGVVVSHLTLCFTENHDGILNYAAMPMWGNTIYNENQNYYSAFITKDCQNVEAAWKLLMAMCSEESAIIQRYGVKGEDWDYAPAGTEAILGGEAKIRVYRDVATTIGNQNWRNVEATFLFDAEGESNQLVPEEETPARAHKYKLFKQALENYNYQMENYNPDDSLICPLLVWPDEYKAELPDAPNECKQCINTYRTDFITGKMDVNDDATWNKYLKELDDCGYAQWEFYSQKIYEQTVAQ